ncbi:MAG: penicillin-binding transpeptidase domain-containing protein, partial [Polyangiaceae bacterium]
MRRLAIGLTAVVLAATLVPLARRLTKNANTATTDSPAVEDVSLSHTKPSESTTKPEAPAISPITSGVDLMHMSFDDSGAIAPTASGRMAKLTIDPEMQHAATTLLRVHRLPRAAIILVDTETGNVLAYASRSEGSSSRDICSEARAPAASVFKIVTGSALVEDAQLTPDTEQCYWGGEHEILAQNLEENASRDKSCTTLAGAMGHSTNAVFAKLALKHLKPE